MEHKKFGELTADEQKELLYARYVKGKCIENLKTGRDGQFWGLYGHHGLKPDLIYRVRPTKPSINWDHVHEKYKWLAINSFGEGVLFTSKPEMSDDHWSTNSSTTMAANFASFQPGDCHWTESLIERPKAA